jgi:uncharacterized RDD family membrane protein YckC
MTSGYSTPEGAIGIDPRATEGTLSRRFFAYLLDIVVIFVLWAIFGTVIFFLGIVTLTLGWALFAVLPFTAIIYNALTISGPSQGTVGMRAAGLQVLDATTGGRVSILAAAVHALLFYVFLSSAGLLLLIDILFGVMRADRRMGRDLITNVLFVRAP